MPTNDDTEQFMDALLGYVPEDRHTLLWTLQDKRSTWTALTDGPLPTAAAARELAAKNRDVYVAVSVADSPGTFDSRINNSNSAGIMGLWADIDIAEEGVHKKTNLPPDEASALDVLDRAGLAPSLVIHSGHGLQAWWLFNEFWEFDTDEERINAAHLSQRWNMTLQVRAGEKGWVVDSTFDLARVMRVPGTMNRKGDKPLPVRLLRNDPVRYSPDDFDEYVVDQSFLQTKGISSAVVYQGEDLKLDSTSTPDFTLFQALMDNDPQFAATFNKARKDFTDQSPSTYDMSLASQAARAGWPDLDIARLIRVFRAKHGLDMEKAYRQDYIKRTIARARMEGDRAESFERIEEVGEHIEEARASGDDEAVRDARREGLNLLTAQLGIEVVHIIRYLSEPPAFAVVLLTHTVAIKGSDGLLRQDKLKQSIWETAGNQIPRFRNAQWDQITALIPRVWEDQEVGSEATNHGEVASWLAHYLSTRPPADSLLEAAVTEYPYIEDGKVVMFGPAFRRWLFHTFQEKLTNKEMGVRLRAFGATPDRVNVEEDGKRTTRSVWRLPPGVLPQSVPPKLTPVPHNGAA